jgi:hypothetical protein
VKVLQDAISWIENHHNFVALVGIIAPILFKRLRAIPIALFRAFQRWAAKDRIAWQNEFTDQVLCRLDRIEEKANKADNALFNHGKAGIVQQIQLLTADANREFEKLPTAQFKCDNKGNNLVTNAAYRRLIGVTKEESLEGLRWKSVIYGELLESYLATFKACSDSLEDFYAECDFRNPVTGEHRGRWRVIAPVLHVGNGSIWVGSLEYAIDERARELAVELGLEIKN